MLTKLKEWLVKIKAGIPTRILIAVVLLLLCAFGFRFWHNSIADTLPHEFAYERWQGESEMDFGQISVFAAAGDSFSEEMLFGFRNALAEKLQADSLEMEKGNLLHDCWSGKSLKTLQTDKAKVNVCAYGVGGYFFDFHNFELVSGSYLTGEYMMSDKVLLDEESAWVLFGATDVAGMDLEIDGKTYMVSGVYRQCPDKYTKKTKDELPTVFMDYRDFAEDTGFRINCYEVILPEIVDGYSDNLVRSTLGLTEAEYVDHRLRYTMAVSFVNLPGITLNSVRKTSVYYPYWENAARILKDKQILLCGFRWLCLIFPILCGIFYGIKIIVYIRKNIKWPKLPFRT